MKTVSVYRQGDVCLLPATELPAEAEQDTSRINGDKLVLEYGEVTGHCHALPTKAATRYVVGSSGKEFVKVNKKTSLVHDEHAPIELPKGLYEGRRCQEWTPTGARKVTD